MDNIFAEGGVRNAQPLQELASPSASIADTAIHYGTESRKERGKAPPLPAMPPARVDHTAAASTACGSSGGLTGGGAARHATAPADTDSTRTKDETSVSPSEKKRTGRRVRFPEGSLITNKFDPPNPWINGKMRFVSVMEN